MRDPDPSLLPKSVTVHRARNPSAMTGLGTNCYIFHGERSFILDPGPEDIEFLHELQTHLTRPVHAILISHAHLDHSGNAQRAQDLFDAPIWAFGDAKSGRDPNVTRFQDHLPQGSGIDHAFVPDHCLQDGDIISTGCDDIYVHHIPGHMGNHLCFDLNGDMFTGDHILDWTTTMIAPPEGSLDDFLSSCQKLIDLAPKCLWPAHGPQISNAFERITEIVDHRHRRHAEIKSLLSQGSTNLTTLRKQLYPNLEPNLSLAAEASLMSHLISLYADNSVYFQNLGAESFEIIPRS